MNRPILSLRARLVLSGQLSPAFDAFHTVPTPDTLEAQKKRQNTITRRLSRVNAIIDRRGK